LKNYFHAIKNKASKYAQSIKEGGGYAHIQGITNSETLNKAFSESHSAFEASKDYKQYKQYNVVFYCIENFESFLSPF
jgi:hypothetical protein